MLQTWGRWSEEGSTPVLQKVLPTDVRGHRRHLPRPKEVVNALETLPRSSATDLQPESRFICCFLCILYCQTLPFSLFPLVYMPLWHGRVHSCHIVLGWALGQGEPSQEEKAEGLSQAITWELPQLRGHGCAGSLPLGALCTTLINRV